VFPVRYGLDFYLLFKRNSYFGMLKQKGIFFWNMMLYIFVNIYKLFGRTCVDTYQSIWCHIVEAIISLKYTLPVTSRLKEQCVTNFPLRAIHNFDNCIAHKARVSLWADGLLQRN
jgi:hypothetical protein